MQLYHVRLVAGQDVFASLLRVGVRKRLLT